MSILDVARQDIRAMKPYGSARSELPRLDVLLNANESPFDPSGGGLNRYPDPQPADLVDGVARHYGVASDQVLVTRGSDEAIDLLVRAFCRAGVDGVAWCPPTFGMYRIAAETQGATMIACPLRAEAGFTLDHDALGAALDGGARIIFLCSPNNPTGHELDRSEILAVADAARDRALVVVDEAYAEFGNRSVIPDLGSRDNLAVLRTFSKALALAGARCGALLADSTVIDLVRRIMPPYPLPTPTIEAALAALVPERVAETREQIEALSRARARLARQLEALPFVEHVFPSSANFLLLRVEDPDRLLARAAGAGIALRDMRSQPGLDRCVRISIGSAEELRRLDDVLASFATVAS